MNFSEASNACNQLNLQLASKDQVEKALKHLFETCRYMISVSISLPSINYFTLHEAGDKSDIKRTDDFYCSYGWVKDGLVVIPRLTSNQKCGKGKVGLVTWNAEHSKTFMVYCFNSSGM